MSFLMRLTSGLGGLIRQPAQPEPAPEAAPTHPNGWFATHLHKKGGKYRVIMHAVLEADRSDVVIYDDAEGAVWVRPVSEFYDGRFAPLSDGEQ